MVPRRWKFGTLSVECVAQHDLTQGSGIKLRVTEKPRGSNNCICMCNRKLYASRADDFPPFVAANLTLCRPAELGFTQSLRDTTPSPMRCCCEIADAVVPHRLRRTYPSVPWPCIFLALSLIHI